MHLNPLYDQKTVPANPRNFIKKIKTRGKALFDGLDYNFRISIISYHMVHMILIWTNFKDMISYFRHN